MLIISWVHTKVIYDIITDDITLWQKYLWLQYYFKDKSVKC